MVVKNPLQEVGTFNPPQRVLLGPGPQNAHPRVHAAMALPQIGHMDAAFLEICEDIKKLLRYAWQTENRFTIPVSGTGSAAWEAAVANLTEPGDVHLIFINGYFGERATDLHARSRAKIETVVKPYGTIFSLEEIEAGLSQYKPKLMWICHAETSTGTLQPLDGIGDLCQKYDCLFLLDTVTSICGVPVNLDKHKVDASYAGTQKCMGCPPGVAPLSFSQRALDRIANRKEKVANWYLDMTMIQKYLDAEGGAPRVYHHTAPITMIYGMREALTLVAEEGLEECHQRHLDTAEYFWEEIEKIGFKCVVPREHRLPSLTTVWVPDGFDAAKLCKIMRERFQIEIGGALGQWAGKVLRIGLMGYNSRKEIAKMCVACLEESMRLSKLPSN